MKVGEMMRFVAAHVDDYGFQYMDTTCDWAGWFGHGIDTPDKWRFGSDNFHDLLARMVERIKQERVSAQNGARDKLTDRKLT